MVAVGDRAESVNFGWMEVISPPYESGTVRNDMKVDVRFDNTGNVREGVLTKTFLLGAVRDGSVEIKPSVGMRFKSTNDGYVEIVEYQGSKKIIIKFENTGNMQYVQLDNLLLGLFSDRRVKDAHSSALYHERLRRWQKRTAEEAERNRRVQEAAAKKQAKLNAANKRKQDKINRELERVAKQQQLLERAKIILIPKQVETNLSKEAAGVLNIDFKDREGNWVLRFKHKDKFVQTRLGRLHNNVTQRPGSNKSYADVTISEEFKDPQKFCDWAVQQPGWGLGYSLDKDVLIRGNREYSADACVFLPQAVNTAIINTNILKKTCISFSKGKYRLKCSFGNQRILVTNIESEEAAFELYIKYKEGYVKRLAEEFKSTIDPRAYEALMAWKFL